MTVPESDEDRSRAEIGANHFPQVAAHLTETVAQILPFEALVPFKTRLKEYFSQRPWDEADAAALSAVVAPHLTTGWWEYAVTPELAVHHGIIDDGYRLVAVGSPDQAPAEDPFDRVFEGPVRPEPTPHPRKVRFIFGGEPGPGVWHRSGEPTDDSRAADLLTDEEISDVMIAGDFVTVGLRPGARWADRLDDVLGRVTTLFAGTKPVQATPITRDELLEVAATGGGRHDLHLLDPDDAPSRRRLLEALTSEDHRARRIAVAVLAESADGVIRDRALRTGYRDDKLSVRRTAIDETRDGEQRDLLVEALADRDAWTRWRALRNLSEIGIGDDRTVVAGLEDDPDFQVRFEAAKVLREEGGKP